VGFGGWIQFLYMNLQINQVDFMLVVGLCFNEENDIQEA
jgi:hypothetical protein